MQRDESQPKEKAEFSDIIAEVERGIGKLAIEMNKTGSLQNRPEEMDNFQDALTIFKDAMVEFQIEMLSFIQGTMTDKKAREAFKQRTVIDMVNNVMANFQKTMENLKAGMSEARMLGGLAINQEVRTEFQEAMNEFRTAMNIFQSSIGSLVGSLNVKTYEEYQKEIAIFSGILREFEKQLKAFPDQIADFKKARTGREYADKHMELEIVNDHHSLALETMKFMQSLSETQKEDTKKEHSLKTVLYGSKTHENLEKSIDSLGKMAVLGLSDEDKKKTLKEADQIIKQAKSEYSEKYYNDILPTVLQAQQNLIIESNKNTTVLMEARERAKREVEEEMSKNVDSIQGSSSGSQWILKPIEDTQDSGEKNSKKSLTASQKTEDQVALQTKKEMDQKIEGLVTARTEKEMAQSQRTDKYLTESYVILRKVLLASLRDELVSRLDKKNDMQTFSSALDRFGKVLLEDLKIEVRDKFGKTRWEVVKIKLDRDLVKNELSNEIDKEKIKNQVEANIKNEIDQFGKGARPERMPNKSNVGIQNMGDDSKMVQTQLEPKQIANLVRLKNEMEKEPDNKRKKNTYDQAFNRVVRQRMRYVVDRMIIDAYEAGPAEEIWEKFKKERIRVAEAVDPRYSLDDTFKGGLFTNLASKMISLHPTVLLNILRPNKEEVKTKAVDEPPVSIQDKPTRSSSVSATTAAVGAEQKGWERVQPLAGKGTLSIAARLAAKDNVSAVLARESKSEPESESIPKMPELPAIPKSSVSAPVRKDSEWKSGVSRTQESVRRKDQAANQDTVKHKTEPPKLR